MTSVFITHITKGGRRIIGLIFLLLLLCIQPISAQTPDSNNTFQEILPDLDIQDDKPSVAIKQSNLDPLENIGLITFIELLQYSTTIHIKDYGSGLATLSFRGTGAQHTNLYWNGVPLNSPALGSSDYSAVNIGLVDAATVNFGGGTTDLSSGGLGGAIALKTGVSSSDKAFLFSKTIGSFGENNTLFSVQEKFKKWKFKIRGNHSYAKNNFKINQYYGDSVVIYQQENAASEQFGLAISTQYKSENHLLSIAGMLTDLQREIPSPLGISSSKENQSDNTKAFSVQLKSYYKEHFNQFIGGCVNQMLLYKNPTAKIYSELSSKTYLVKDKFTFNVKNFKTFVQVGALYDAVENSGYSELKDRVTILGNTAVVYENSKVKTALSIKADIVNTEFMPLNPDFGLEYKPFESNALLFEVKASKNYRLPTLNDLYWFPGGNEYLETEESHSAEFGVSTERKTVTAKLNLLARTFINKVDNWIIWLPNGTIWSPENVKKVLNSGLEIEGSIAKAIFKNNGLFVAKANYAYTKAISKESNLISDASLGKQLIFVPQHQGTVSIKLNYSKLSLAYGQSITGQTFINSVNTAYMPYYAPAYLKISYVVLDKTSNVSCSFQINNLFNEEYQIMPNRPLPGQHYSLNVTWRYNEK